MIRARVLLLSRVAAISLLAAGCSSSGVDRPVHTAGAVTGPSGMGLSSSAFAPQGAIPVRYTCDGADVSPPLAITGLPAGAVSLVVVMDDPDAPRGTWDHWVAYDLPVADEIEEGAAALGTPGDNSWGEEGYRGPCPPGGTHRYFFTVYALDANLGFSEGMGKGDVLEAISGHVLGDATLIGTYSR